MRELHLLVEVRHPMPLGVLMDIVFDLMHVSVPVFYGQQLSEAILEEAWRILQAIVLDRIEI